MNSENTPHASGTRFALASAFALVAAFTSARAAEPIAFSADARVEIDATGKPTKVEAAPELPEAIRSFIERKVATWHFAPPSRDGESGSGVTYLQLGACAMPEGNGYRMAIDYKGNGPRRSGSGILFPPRYPPEAQRAGEEADLRVTWIVEPDGRATLENILREDRPVTRKSDPFQRVVREWVASLRYEPEELAGRRLRTRVSVPVEFRLDARSAGATREQLLEQASQSTECRMAASKLQQGLQPVAVDSPFKRDDAG